jgi:hypothetical protein
LLFSLGLKNLGKAREAAALEEEAPLPVESEPERTIIAQTFSQFATPVPVVAVAPVPVKAAEPAPVAVAEAVPVATPIVETKVASAAQREVKTAPEFLPPREFVPVREAANGREDYDEFQTLPSRRGQYKRRG